MSRIVVSIAVSLAFIAAILAVLILLFEVVILLVGSQKGDGDESNRIGLIRSGSDLRTAVQFTVLLASELGYLRPGPVPHTESQVARVTGPLDRPGGLASDSGEPAWRGLVVLPDLSVVMVDPEFAATMFSVMACESRFRSDAVGAAGERGLLQIHPIHQGRMEDMGLDFTKEKDRVVFANALWREQGWRPWTCKPTYRSDGTSGEW